MNKHSRNRDMHISSLISSVLILLIGTLHAQCPPPSFGSTPSACGSSSVTLSASSNDASTTHHYWYTSQSGGSGVATTNQYAPMPGRWVSELTATFSSSVTYWVSAYCNGVESTSRTPVSFTLLSPGAININPSVQPMICQGTSITLTPANGTSYSWSSSPGGAISGSGAITVSPSVNTTYTLTGTESNCGTTVTSTINVTVYPLVGTASISGPSSRCQDGGPSNYAASAANATTFTWSMTAAAGSISTSGGVTWSTSYPASGNASGTAGITVVASNGCGSGSPVTKNVTVYALPMAYTLNAPTGICPGATVAIYLSGSQTWVSYQLYKDGNASGSAIVGNGSQLAFPGITQAGTYSITATGTGCSSVNMINSVNLTTLSPGTLSASKNPGTPVCQGAPVQLSAGGGGNYSWTADTGGSWSGSPITVTPSSNTVYTVTGNESNCGTSVSTTTSVGVYTLPTAMASNQTICSGSSTSITITNPNSVPGTTYAWTAGSAVNITAGYTTSGNGTPIAQPLSSADGVSNGFITYTITPSANNCPGPTVQVTVTVKPTPTTTNTNTQLHPTACSGTALNFIPTFSINGTTYSWTSSFSGPISPGSISPNGSGAITNTPVNTGTANGTVTYHFIPNYNGCGLAFDYVVTVNPLPAAPTFSVPTVPLCGAKTLTRGIPADGSTWYWQGIIANGQDQSQAAAATTYSATLSGTNTYYLRALSSPSSGGCWSTTGAPVTVNLVPAAPSSAVSTINTCDAKTLTKGTPPVGIGWYWQGTNAGLQDYTSSIATSPTYTVTANNTYYLSARSNAGCWSLTSTPLLVTTYPADLTISSYDPANTVVQATRSIRLLPGFASTGGTFNSKIAFTAECNDNVNWTEESGFDQNGQTISRSRTYIDGLGNQLQSQSMDYLSGKVWATQPLYDNLNRAAGSTLPAPILESDFLLKKNFVQNAAGQWYSATDFDNPIVNGSAGEVNNPKAVGNQPGTLGWYFSTANNLESQTPTTAFPYSRNYTPAGPNPTTSLSAGSGNYHYMGTGHETKSDRYLIVPGEVAHYYSLRSYFSNSTTTTGLGYKYISTDPDGKQTASFVDADGHTIATAMVMSANYTPNPPAFTYDFWSYTYYKDR